MPKKLSREAQTIRYYRRRRISRISVFVCGIVLRLLGIVLTAVCAYLVFFDAEAITLKGIAAAVLFVIDILVRKLRLRKNKKPGLEVSGRRR